MRFVRSVQVAIGLAATGGMAVVLSGSALAADSGLNTTSQNVSTPSTAVLEQVVAPGDGSGATKKEAPAEAAGEAKSSEEASGQAQAATDEQPVTPKIGPVSELVKPAQLDQPAATVEAPALGAMLPGKGEQSGVMPAVESAESLPMVTISAIEPQVTGSVSEGSAAVASTMVLRLQPTITNRVAVLAEDLASAVPSAPSPEAPKPATSTGLLGHLKAELAGTALPQLIFLHAIAAGNLTAILGLLALTLLLVNVFTFTYGLWLRRGGFATAARSDSPAESSSPFATPFLLGYATLSQRSHSPIFNGGRNETKIVSCVLNVFRKEERS